MGKWERSPGYARETKEIKEIFVGRVKSALTSSVREVHCHGGDETFLAYRRHVPPVDLGLKLFLGKHRNFKQD